MQAAARRRSLPQSRLAHRRDPRSTRSSTTSCSPSPRRSCAPGSRLGSGQGDALAALPAEGGQGVGAAYADEHRPLIMLALGRPGAAAALVRAANSAGVRGARLRIAGAALLARRGDRDGALALLEGDAGPIACRARPDPGAPSGPGGDRRCRRRHGGIARPPLARPPVAAGGPARRDVRPARHLARARQ